MKYTIQGYCNLRRVDYQKFIDASSVHVNPNTFVKEVFEKKSIEALLEQTDAIAIRPVNLLLNGQERTLVVAVRENGTQANIGAEYDNMVDSTHFIVISKKYNINNSAI